MSEISTLTSLRLAATVVLIRDSAPGIQVLLLRRNSKLAFYGGAWVFPGGKVDPKDEVSGITSEESLSRVAACREAFEEAGVKLLVEQLMPLSLWIPPVETSKRYLTRFFLATLSNQKITIDDSEIKDFNWLSPELAIKAHSNNEIELAPATFVTLNWLNSFKSALEVKASVPRIIDIFEPKTITMPEGKISLYQGDAGYESSEPSKDGARHRLTMIGRPYIYDRYI